MIQTTFNPQQSLDELAAQAAASVLALDGVLPATFKRRVPEIIREALEAATQALREQVEQLQDALKRSNKSACDEIALSARLSVDAERLQQQLAQVTQGNNKQIEQLASALVFYADQANYASAASIPSVMRDGGRRAVEALKTGSTSDDVLSTLRALVDAMAIPPPYSAVRDPYDAAQTLLGRANWEDKGW